MEEVKERFSEVYEILKSEILQYPGIKSDSLSYQLYHKMLDYNVNVPVPERGMSVIQSLGVLRNVQHPIQLSERDFFLASVLGWCNQWLLVSVRVPDGDVLPCWSRVPKPKVGKLAINDGFLLWNQINRILRNHFRNQPYYVHLLELFNEVEFHSTSGEMINLISSAEARQELTKFTSQLHRRISKFKTAYERFYLPFASALLMSGEKLDDYIEVKEILLDMGIYFQVQEDYLDCFGDPEKIGKDNYGKADPANVAIVKSLYNDLNLQDVFADYEIEVVTKITDRIEGLSSKPVQSVLKGYLADLCKRKKQGMINSPAPGEALGVTLKRINWVELLQSCNDVAYRALCLSLSNRTSILVSFLVLVMVSFSVLGYDNISFWLLSFIIMLGFYCK